MPQPLTLMAILAHPDDESLGFGGTLARYAAEGVATHLVTATRGERGWFGPAEANPGLRALGQRREAELRAAAAMLGLGSLALLDYIDGDLDRAEPAAAAAAVAAHLRRVRPHVVITFGADGGYGHPDHIAIAQFTAAAIVLAADSSFAPSGVAEPHQVAKLYYRVWTQAEGDAYTAVFGDIGMLVDGVQRRPTAAPDWLVTACIDGRAHWETAWRAIACHRTQVPEVLLEQLAAPQHRDIWAGESYYRVFSLVNGGRQREADLFTGLR